MKKYILFFLVNIISSSNKAQQTGVIMDTRDSRTYKTIEIFSQIWMVDNLNSDKFQNGDKIPKVNSSQEWIKACQRKEPVWMYYDNNAENGKKYGKIYNYYAVIDKRNIAPINFHIPSINEFISLSKLSAISLKSRDGWYSTTYRKRVLDNVDKIDINGFPYVDLDLVEKVFTLGGSGNNSSGFDAYPSGRIESNGTFSLFGREINFWSLTKGSIPNTHSAYRIAWDDNETHIFNANITQGFYIRCVNGRSQEEIENERQQKYKREKFIADSIYVEKIKYEKYIDDLNQKREDSIKSNNKIILEKKEDSLKNTLALFDKFKEGIVIKLNETNGVKHGLLMHIEENLLRMEQLVNKYSVNEDGWRIPTVPEMQLIITLAKTNNDFNNFFEKSKNKGNTYGWGKAEWWYALPDLNVKPTIDNLWWVFKSKLGRDQQIKDKYNSYLVEHLYARLRLVKEF